MSTGSFLGGASTIFEGLSSLNQLISGRLELTGASKLALAVVGRAIQVLQNATHVPVHINELASPIKSKFDNR